MAEMVKKGVAVSVTKLLPNIFYLMISKIISAVNPKVVTP